LRSTDFFYDLPESAIAQAAIEPRDDARLLDTRDLSDHTFHELPDLLNPGDLVVVNETKVRLARLVGERSDTGGRVELLVLSVREDGLWEGLARPSRRLRPGLHLEFDGLGANIREGPDEGIVVVEFDTPNVEEAIERAGKIPLPPYFHGTLDDPDRYQTMFAVTPGSAAAPTAGLHFTDRVVAGLAEAGIKIARVDLHVGIDTFRPIAVDSIEDHSMHAEWCSIPETTAAAVEAVRDREGRVVAIGTTTVRTLESMANDNGTVTAGARDTDLFLRPGSRFRVVDALVTNFHVPGSTLVVLVAAFMGDAWREAYETALQRGYRFLSFGDAMYTERRDP
jgi:S-adenosylmethionine:tRNA ribosyltransferase-isomerase